MDCGDGRGDADVIDRKELSVYVAALAAGFAAMSPFLPDTAVGSPRAVVFALSVGLASVAVALRGTT